MKKCDICGDEPKYFHSKCCKAHFEGIISRKGELQIVCEKCGKHVGTLQKKYSDVEFPPPFIFPKIPHPSGLEGENINAKKSK